MKSERTPDQHPLAGQTFRELQEKKEAPLREELLLRLQSDVWLYRKLCEHVEVDYRIFSLAPYVAQLNYEQLRDLELFLDSQT